ncbi:MAG TPA: DNA-binding protein [Pseudomonas sp.]|nr:DNA-binding protein [Pseudomonas sp.]
MTTAAHRFSEAVSLSPTDLLTPDQLAAALGLSHRTLAAWRSNRRGGPAWVKCGSSVRYRRQDVAAWLDSQTQTMANNA